MNIARLGIHESVDEVFPPARLRDALSDLEPEVAVVGSDRADLERCDAIVTLDHVAAFGETVAWVHTIQAGYDRFPLREFEEHEIVLTNSAGIHGTSVGETVTGYMLMLARGLHRHAKRQPTRRWEQPAWDDAFTLEDESVCVVGLGTLGRGIVDRAAALGMHVTGVRKSGEPVTGVDRVYRSEELHDAIAEPTFVVLATPLNEETRRLIGPAELEMMRDDAYLLNVSRGEVVDEGALVAALRNDELAGAALDVFETEPLPEDSPLWEMDDVIVTPHCAAFTRDYYRDVAALVRENVERHRNGKPMKNRVL